MGALDEIRKMSQEGMSEQDIASSLKDRGLSDREISNAFAQARIKEAVSNGPPVPSPTEGETDVGEETIPSIMNQPQYATQEMPKGQGQEPDLFTEPSSVSAPSPEQAQAQTQAPSEEAQAYYPAPSGYDNSSQENQGYSYSPQSSSMSSDTISEIAEQVVAEKFYPIAKELEKVIDMRTTIDSRISYLDERLKRIEAIIDKLQMSVLQKMTDYVSDVRDMKTELVETQKSFKSLMAGHKK